MRMQATAWVMVVALSALTAPAWSGEKKTMEKRQEGAASQRIEAPKDCADIKSGTGSGTTTEEAARKDCEASRHLGGDRGTSSGTGSGKMQSGSGPR